MIRDSLLPLCLLASLATFHAEGQAAAPVGPAMTKAAQNFLAALDEKSLAKATMAFDDPARLDWHNIPKPQRKGLQYRDMSPKQRELCHELLKTGLSTDGYQKLVNIMALENNLKEGEKLKKGTPFRDPQRYFLTIFGKPDNSGTWGWSFEGHHLSLNFVLRDGKVVSDTPSFWGSNPATVKVFVEGGPKVGTRNLASEEQLAFDLINSLSDENRKIAVFSAEPPEDYRNPGKPQPPTAAPVGLAASKMTDAQKKTLWSLLKVYCNHLAPELASRNLEQLKSEGIDQVYFGWAGSTKPGVGHYYRVQGPSFVLELVNIQSDPQGNKANHIHSVWRNLNGDFAQSISASR